MTSLSSTEPSAAGGPSSVSAVVSGLTANVRYAAPPQIVAHEASVGDLAVRAVSYRGPLHALDGGPRQDAFALATGGGWLIAVVSDGIGSCEYSEHGSTAAAYAVAVAVALGEADPADGQSLMKIAALACEEAAHDLAVDANSVSATLTVAAIATKELPDGGRRVLLHSIGDSPALLLEPAEPRWSYLTPRDDGPSNVVPGWIPGNYQDSFGIGFTLPSNSILVLCSDGFSVPLGTGDGPLGTDLARRWAAGPRDLVAFLVDLSFDAHYDDKTVVGIWNSWPRTTPTPHASDQKDQ